MTLAKPAKRVVVFDLDETLIDTSRIKKYQERAVEAIGISPRLFRETYKDASFMVHSEYPYWHASAMARESAEYENPVLTDRICKVMMAELELRAPYLVFVDAVRCLRDLRASGIDVIILTRGSWLYQCLKIKFAGLLEYVTDTIIAQEDKHRCTFDILDRYDFSIFVDDDPRVLEDIVMNIGISSAKDKYDRCAESGVFKGQCVHINRGIEVSPDQESDKFVRTVSSLDASFLASLVPTTWEGDGSEKK